MAHVSDQWIEETHTQLQCRSFQHPTLWHQHWPGRSAGQGELSRPVKHPISKLKSPWWTWILSVGSITKSNAVLNCIQLPFAGVRGLWQMGCGYFQNIWVFWQPSPNGSDVHDIPGIKCGIKKRFSCRFGQSITITNVLNLYSTGKRPVENLQNPCRHIHYLHDGIGGELPLRCSVP